MEQRYNQRRASAPTFTSARRQTTDSRSNGRIAPAVGAAQARDITVGGGGGGLISSSSSSSSSKRRRNTIDAYPKKIKRNSTGNIYSSRSEANGSALAAAAVAVAFGGGGASSASKRYSGRNSCSDDVATSSADSTNSPVSRVATRTSLDTGIPVAGEDSSSPKTGRARRHVLTVDNLNVSAGRDFYEKARSRNARHSAVLKEHDAHTAVPLGSSGGSSRIVGSRGSVSRQRASFGSRNSRRDSFSAQQRLVQEQGSEGAGRRVTESGNGELTLATKTTTSRKPGRLLASLRGSLASARIGPNSISSFSMARHEYVGGKRILDPLGVGALEEEMEKKGESRLTKIIDQHKSRELQKRRQLKAQQRQEEKKRFEHFENLLRRQQQKHRVKNNQKQHRRR